jgi:Phytanoyl-CoA dioxygenase (PhyH)
MISMTSPPAIPHALGAEGFAIVEGVLSGETIDLLIRLLENQETSGALRRQGKQFAVRNLLDLPEINELAHSGPVCDLVRVVLGDVFFPVRGILFDKIPAANWKVPWHQDVTIAVREKADVKGFGPWSLKAGIQHVQPPPSVLERMISVRLHLDTCEESNGALRVIPGSHRQGRISEAEIGRFVENGPERICAVDRGGALLMRPLLLHASSPSSSPAHRRVIHLDFASEPLPNPLRWLSEPCN